MASGMTARVPVVDADHGGLVGWVMWDEVGDFEQIDEVAMPTAFYLRCPGGSDQPSLQLNFEVRDGRAACTEMRLESKPAGREVLPKDVEIVRRKMTDWSEVAVTTVMRASEEHSPGALDQRQARRAYQSGQKKSRRKVTDEVLAEVAALYRDNIDQGPWRAIGERFSVSDTTAGRYVLLARKAGHLPQTEPGKKKA